MKLLTVVGARPQFIKAAVGSRVLRKGHTEILVHTGQHHDPNMSDVFFEEMEIPRPDYNLGIAGGSHAVMTARMLVELEALLLKEKPDATLVYGDTNSTLAAALASVKQHVPVIHVEAGNRFGTLESPEEVNRICTDHVSSLRFSCTQSALDSLRQENLAHGSYLSGDPMYDAFLFYKKKALSRKIELTGLRGETFRLPKQYNYMTCHRQENTKTPAILSEILTAMQMLNVPTVYPVHPRNRDMVLEMMKDGKFSNVLFVEPVGYLESVALVCGCKQIVTDSGGLQREAFFAGKQCVTVLDFVVWPETMIGNRNQLARPEHNDIVSKLSVEQQIDPNSKPFGDGHAAEFISAHMLEIQS